MQPSIKELEEKYNKMRDDQILGLLEDEWMRKDALEILQKIATKRWLKFVLLEKKEDKHISSSQKIKLKPEENFKIEKKIKNLGIFMQICWFLITLINILTLPQLVSVEIFGILYGCSLFMSWRVLYKLKTGDSFKYINQLLKITILFQVCELFFTNWQFRLSLNVIIVAYIIGWYLNDKDWQGLKLTPKKQINDFYLWCLFVFWLIYYLLNLFINHSS